VLSLGRNQITDHEDAIRKMVVLPKLEVLKMADNKFSAHQKDDYEQFAIAFLKNLKYLDYELIEEDKRTAANEKYKDAQTDKMKDIEKAKEGKEVEPEIVAAHCTSTIGIFKTVIDDDEEMKKLRLIPEAFSEAFTSSDTDVGEAQEKFLKNIKDYQIRKVDIIDHCMKILKAAEDEAELKSIKMNEEFARHFKHVIKYCEDDKEDLDNLDN